MGAWKLSSHFYLSPGAERRAASSAGAALEAARRADDAGQGPHQKVQIQSRRRTAYKCGPPRPWRRRCAAFTAGAHDAGRGPSGRRGSEGSQIAPKPRAVDVHQEPLEYSPRARGPNPPPIGIHRVARLPLPPQRRRCHHQCAAFTALVRTRLLASVKSTPPPTSTASTHSTSADHHVSISRESSVFAATAGAEGGSSSPTPA